MRRLRQLVGWVLWVFGVLFALAAIAVSGLGEFLVLRSSLSTAWKIGLAVVIALFILHEVRHIFHEHRARKASSK